LKKILSRSIVGKKVENSDLKWLRHDDNFIQSHIYHNLNISPHVWIKLYYVTDFAPERFFRHICFSK
jgi:hypothetical protein